MQPTGRFGVCFDPAIHIKSLRRVVFLLEKELHVLSCYRIAPGQRIFCGVSVDEYTRGTARIVVKSDALVRCDLFWVTPTDCDQESVHGTLLYDQVQRLPDAIAVEWRRMPSSRSTGLTERI